MWIDTHLHLDEPWLTDDKLRQKTIADITENKIVTWAQSCDIPSYEKTLEYSKDSEYIFPSFGILPWYANEYMERLDEVRKLSEEALMIGEIGLDMASSRNKATKEEQDALFSVFLEVSEKRNKILNCHFRGGLEENGFEFLSSYDIKKGIFHHYSGPPEMIDKINEHGFYVSYGSAGYYKLSKGMQDYLNLRLPKVHDDLLIVEIDVLGRGVDYKPPSVVFPKILQVLADIKKTTPDEIEALNYKNVLRLVGNDSKLKPMFDLPK